MNMKKTIAAVSACAVAVAAMATTVSAYEDSALAANTSAYTEGSINYSLVVEQNVKTRKADLTISVYSQKLMNDGEDLFITIFGGYCSIKNADVVLTGLNKDTNKPISYTFVTDSSKANYSGIDYVQYNNTNRIVIAIPQSSSIYAAFATDNGKTAAAEIANLSITLKGVDATNYTGQDRINADTSSHAISAEFGGVYSVNASGIGKLAYAASPATTLTGNQNVLAKSATKTMVAADNTLTTAAWSETSYMTRQPFHTDYNGATYYINSNYSNITGNTNDIITRLTKADGVRTAVDAGTVGGKYDNALAVINDIVANYDTVTFKFNTATSNVITSAWKTHMSELKGSWIDTDSYWNYIGYYTDNLPNNWIGGDSQYKSFGQHLYNLYGDETTNYVGYNAYDWSASNLFAGALIVNDSLSMSLNNTEAFTYSNTALEFKWDELNTGASVNAAVNYIQTMKLATSTDWYWDSMDVTFSNTAAEDASDNSEVDADEDTIDEDTTDEEITDEDTTDEEVTDEEATDEEAPAEEEVTDEEEAPAEDVVVDETPAENPATGNAPIALAVIPVALAAAAIVAKKRN